MTTHTIVKCANCNGLNAHGLSFCMFCGSSLVGTDDVKLISPRPCNACSVVDPLSQKYCVSCGATMNPSREHTVLVQQKPALAQSSPRLKQREKKQRAERKTRQAIIGAAAAAGIAGLLVSGAYLYSLNQTAQNTGLLVYASPSGADVFVEDSHNCLVKSGKIKSNGELLLKGMAAGRYSLTVSKLGYKPSEQSVVLAANKIASIGIPERIDLLSLERAASPDNANSVSVSSVDQSIKSIASPIRTSGNLAPSRGKSKEAAKSLSNEGSLKIDKTISPIEINKAELEPIADAEKSRAETAKALPETDNSNSATADTTLQGLAEQDAISRNEALSPQAPLPNEEPFVPNKFMRRRMQNPQMERRFAQGFNGPFRAVGYPVVLPSQSNLKSRNEQPSFVDQNGMPPSRRFRPDVRQFMKMIQNQPGSDHR